MREKLLAKLKQKFPGLPASFLGLYADKMATKVTAETEIEGAVNELDNLPVSLPDLAANFQTESDRRVTEAVKKATEKKPTTQNQDAPITDPPPSDNAALAKQVADLSKIITGMQQQQTQKSLSDQLHAKLKEKKIPLHLAKGRVVEKAEDLDTILGEIETDYTEIKQGLVDEGLLSATTPVVGGGGPKNLSNIEDDMKKWSEKNKVAQPAKA